jgi:hypothetical protein
LSPRLKQEAIDQDFAENAEGTDLIAALVALRYVMLTQRASELEAQADGGIERGSLEVAVSATIRHLRPHDTCKSFKALRETTVGNEGNRIQLSTALRQAGI